MNSHTDSKFFLALFDDRWEEVGQRFFFSTTGKNVLHTCMTVHIVVPKNDFPIFPSSWTSALVLIRYLKNFRLSTAVLFMI